MNSTEYILAHNKLAVLINAQTAQSYWSSEEGNMQLDQAIVPPQSNASKSDLICVSCSDDSGTKLTIAACDHGYCRECLGNYVKSSLDPGATFPPQCCNRPLTLQLVEGFLPEALVLRFRTKQASIAEACALICAEPNCRLIVEEEDIVGDLGHCQGCNRYTCTKCRTTQHNGKDCPTDAERQEVLELAKARGWQACFRCNNMVELNVGCNHITCLCRAEFCYVCGTPWKGFACDWFAHDFIDDNAEAREARPQRPRLVPRTVFRADKALTRYEKYLGQTLAWKDPRPREEQLEEIRAVVETGCDHGYWRRIGTSREYPGHCKLCQYIGRKFIFQCFNCPLTACWACHTDEPPEFRPEEPAVEANA